LKTLTSLAAVKKIARSRHHSRKWSIIDINPTYVADWADSSCRGSRRRQAVCCLQRMSDSADDRISAERTTRAPRDARLYITAGDCRKTAAASRWIPATLVVRWMRLQPLLLLLLLLQLPIRSAHMTRYQRWEMGRSIN